MSLELIGRDVFCPYCGETISLDIDCSVEMQSYIEDCQVCCRPIVVDVSVDEHGSAEVQVRSENE